MASRVHCITSPCIRALLGVCQHAATYGPQSSNVQRARTRALPHCAVRFSRLLPRQVRHHRKRRPGVGLVDDRPLEGHPHVAYRARLAVGRLGHADAQVKAQAVHPRHHTGATHRRAAVHAHHALQLGVVLGVEVGHNGERAFRQRVNFGPLVRLGVHPRALVVRPRVQHRVHLHAPQVRCARCQAHSREGALGGNRLLRLERHRAALERQLAAHSARGVHVQRAARVRRQRLGQRLTRHHAHDGPHALVQREVHV
mmetsp:Transcript_14731/g.45944  ORF Transcript_14731/g.45944 Transcript_14731/m.45944 type:complete len:256 (-) Transcript_14731:180-947(-)